jgi:hypothetical protein
MKKNMVDKKKNHYKRRFGIMKMHARILETWIYIQQWIKYIWKRYMQTTMLEWDIMHQKLMCKKTKCMP